MMENHSAYEPVLEIIAEEYESEINASHHSAMRAE